MIVLALLVAAPPASHARSRLLTLLGVRSGQDAAARFLVQAAERPLGLETLELLEVKLGVDAAARSQPLVDARAVRRHTRAGLLDVHRTALQRSATAARDEAELDGFGRAVSTRCIAPRVEAGRPALQIPADATRSDATFAWTCMLTAGSGDDARLVVAQGKDETEILMAGDARGTPVRVARLPHRAVDLPYEGDQLLPAVELARGWYLPTTGAASAWLLVFTRTRPPVPEIGVEEILVAVRTDALSVPDRGLVASRGGGRPH